MPAIKPIAVKDGATTPATHTFVPVRVDGDTASFVERSSTSSIGNRALTVAMKPGAKAAPVSRVAISFEIPVTAVAQGSTVEVVDHTNRVNVEFIMAKRGTRQGRLDLLAMFRDALDNSDVKLVITDLENMY